MSAKKLLNRFRNRSSHILRSFQEPGGRVPSLICSQQGWRLRTLASCACTARLTKAFSVRDTIAAVYCTSTAVQMLRLYRVAPFHRCFPTPTDLHWRAGTRWVPRLRVYLRCYSCSAAHMCPVPQSLKRTASLLYEELLHIHSR